MGTLLQLFLQDSHSNKTKKGIEKIYTLKAFFTKMYELLLFLILGKALSEEPPVKCCMEKEVGGIMYSLVDVEQGLGEDYGCKDDCLYKTNGGDDLVCFATGSLPVNLCDGDVYYGVITMTEGNETFEQLNTFNSTSGLFTARVPAHRDRPAAVIYLSTEWNYTVVCTATWDRAIETGPQSRDDLMGLLNNGAVIGPNTTERERYTIIEVSNETLPMDSGPVTDPQVDIRRPIYMATETPVSMEEFDNQSKGRIIICVGILGHWFSFS